MPKTRWAACLLTAATWTTTVTPVVVTAQTTQGVIRGRITNSSTGESVEGAHVICYNPDLNDTLETYTDSRGGYSLTPLSPATYRIRFEKADYQARDVYSLNLYVASRLDLNVALRPLTEAMKTAPGGFLLPDNQAVLPVLGPDLDLTRSAPLDVSDWKSSTLQSALSYVISPQQTGELPLAARNVYTMIVTLPGVVAEEATGRGLGLAVGGLRPSSSEFLLDGAENNDYMLTGPFSVVPLEGMQEYRVTTHNFSAEYGRAAGFVANAVTRSGSNVLHGLAYGYLNNDVLNAAGFQENANGIRRTPQKEFELGYSAGGPIRKDRLFFSSSLDRYRNRALSDPQLFIVPVLSRFQACASQYPAGSIARAIGWLSQFPPPTAFAVPPLNGNSPCSSLVGVAQTVRPVSIDRTTAIERLDYRSPAGADRLMARAALNRLAQPDQEYTIYSQIQSGMSRGANGVALNYTHSLSRGGFNEARLSWRGADLQFQRPQPDTPSLDLLNDNLSLDLGNYLLNLPGSGLPYSVISHENNWEIADNVTRAWGAHLTSAGAGMLVRRQDFNIPLLNYATYGFLNDGTQQFPNAQYFALSAPLYYVIGVSRESLMNSGTLVLPDSLRRYSNNQFYAFAQDSWKITARLNLNAGIRYESLGNLRNTGATDAMIQLATGSTIEQRLQGAQLIFPPGGESLYPADRNNWAPRLGVAYNLKGGTVLRAAYGIFYDALYTNLFVNPFNNTVPALFCTVNCSVSTFFDFTQPVANLLSPSRFAGVGGISQSLLWVDPHLRTPYAQNWFAGIQRQITDRWYVEVSHLGSAGRKLVTNDVVNRMTDPGGPINPGLPDLDYRSSSGASNYAALGALAHYRSTVADFQVSYTWSHAIDNQSDPLLLDAFNLTQFNPEDPGAAPILSTFSRPFDSRIDRASSDFDIRQNLVFHSVWHIPGPRGGLESRIAGGWQLSQLADFRSGLPYSVLYNEGDPDNQQRPNLLPGTQAEIHKAVPGGVQLLDSNAFAAAPAGAVGSLGRNSFTGPGFWNIDFSLARTFGERWFGEGRHFQFRMDAFNVLNHTNLGQPNTNLGQPPATFGVALYGRPLGAGSAFPSVTPLYPTARRVQLQLKFYF